MLLELEATTKPICLPLFGNAPMSTHCHKIRETNLGLSNGVEKTMSYMSEFVSIAHY